MTMEEAYAEEKRLLEFIREMDELDKEWGGLAGLKDTVH